MNKFSLILIAFGSLSLLGMYFSILYGRKTKAFRWSEYIALVSVPVVCSLGLAYFFGPNVIALFIKSAIIGLILEYCLGSAYHKTLNKRLWTYERFNLGGYTSWLTIPMWGVAGVIFWLISKSVGL